MPCKLRRRHAGYCSRTRCRVILCECDGVPASLLPGVVGFPCRRTVAIRVRDIVQEGFGLRDWVEIRGRHCAHWPLFPRGGGASIMSIFIVRDEIRRFARLQVLELRAQYSILLLE